eukprot:TRINITY_DN1497_c0_g1_i1.p1 TRINITY_DN1497_c0_g1~~TRINITY_DN1497_c0_g1_i1.p1  ORF type:complete len:386 (-),score=119.31 TRINITY_DN1497_c0_g1_i1:70-1116(-)
MIVEGKPLKLDICDTAGQEEYSTMTQAYMKKGDGFILAYSVNSQTSFYEVQEKYNRILTIKDSVKVPIVLVGNKADLEDEREVSFKEGQELAQSWDIPFYELSAKEDQGDKVAQPFIKLTEMLNSKEDIIAQEMAETGTKKRKKRLFLKRKKKKSSTGEGGELKQSKKERKRERKLERKQSKRDKKKKKSKASIDVDTTIQETNENIEIINEEPSGFLPHDSSEEGQKVNLRVSSNQSLVARKTDDQVTTHDPLPEDAEIDNVETVVNNSQDINNATENPPPTNLDTGNAPPTNLNTNEELTNNAPPTSLNTGNAPPTSMNTGNAPPTSLNTGNAPPTSLNTEKDIEQ